MSVKNLLSEIFKSDIRFGPKDLQGLDRPHTFKTKDQGFYFTYNPKTFTLLIHSTEDPYHDKLIKLGQNQEIMIDVGDYKGFVDVNKKQIIFDKNPKRTKQKLTPNIKEFKKILTALISINKNITNFQIKDFFPGWNLKVSATMKKPDPYQAILQRNANEISRMKFYFGTSAKTFLHLDIEHRGIKGNNKFIHDSYLGRGLPITTDKNKAFKRADDVTKHDGYSDNFPIVLEFRNLVAYNLYPSDISLPLRFKKLEVLKAAVPKRMINLWKDVVSKQFLKMLQFADKNYPKLIRTTLEKSENLFYFGDIPIEDIKVHQKKGK